MWYGELASTGPWAGKSLAYEELGEGQRLSQVSKKGRGGEWREWHWHKPTPDHEGS